MSDSNSNTIKIGRFPFNQGGDFPTDAYIRINQALKEIEESEEDYNSKVDKVDGMGLSSNDFTDEYKEKLDKLPTSEELEGDLGKISSEFEEIYKSIQTLNSELEGKVDSEEGSTLFTSEDRLKLEDLGTQVQDLSEKTTSNDYTDQDKALVQTIKNKIDKIEGKGLSDNNFTDEYRFKLDNLEEFAGSGVEVVETKAELDTREDLKESGQPVYIVETDEMLYWSSVQERFVPYTNVVESDTAPDNTDVIWIDSSEKGIPEYTNEDLRAILLAIKGLQETVDKHDFAFNEAMVSGSFQNSTRLKILNATTPIEPLNESGDEPIYPEYPQGEIPNVRHISIKMGKKSELQVNKQNFITGELLYCYDTNQLYIYYNGQFKLVGSNSGGGGGGNIDYEALDQLNTIGFISESGNAYRVKVSDKGELIIYKKELDTPQPEKPGNGLYLEKVYINSVYCGGLNQDEHSYNPCSHNFVELSNLTNNDLNLNGLSLQYSNGGNTWEVLPLWGEIKAQSTFLIRGAQCSVLNTNTTRIKVENYDMEWIDSTGELIRFDNTKCKFYLTWGTAPCAVASPYKKTGSVIEATNGYIDFVGFNKEGATSVDIIDGSENKPYTYLNSNRLFAKYYAMDPVSQATKALTARNNANDWYFVELEKDNIPTVDAYVPRASKENKNIFYNKTKLDSTKPNLLNITFGIQATAPNATRCFNWVSVGYHDEFIWYRKQGDAEWVKVESFKNEFGVRKYYNRIRTEATDGTAYTVHKIIIKNLSAGVYEYKVGRDESYISDVRTFTVREGSDTFRFVHTSDQQGFNWDEYIVWRKSAEYIRDNVDGLQFTINTGDLTQNGNRINEWLDYHSGHNPLNMFEEMTTIGNNDLCPANVYALGSGNDASKVNPINLQYFYTYEIDEENPPVFEIDGKEVYVQSLYSFNYGSCHFMCVNTEIPALAETTVFGIATAGTLYHNIKNWCERDVKNHENSTWKIAFCHEMPFTIITAQAIRQFYLNKVENPNIVRGGARINTNTLEGEGYWFSKFCQENDIRLVLGGHKHTYSCSWPLEESNVSMKPIIQITQSDLERYFSSTSLYTETDGSLAGQSFPESWRNDVNYETRKHLCTFKLVDKITAPVYSMLQATGYKLTSNKELPAPEIPWLRWYFPAGITITGEKYDDVTATANDGQKYPFYTIWDITPEKLTGTAKKIDNILTKGKFNINQPNANTPIAIGGNGETNNGNDLIEIYK